MQLIWRVENKMAKPLVNLLIGAAFALELGGGAIALTSRTNTETQSLKDIAKNYGKALGYVVLGTGLGFVSLYEAKKLDNKYKTYDARNDLK